MADTDGNHGPMIAVAQLGEPGAVDVARDALDEAGIPSELKQIGNNPYIPPLRAFLVELRVPAARVAEAENILARVSHESEEALTHQALALPPDEQARADALREAEPPRRRKSPGLGLIYGLFVPVLGPIYAGSPSLALASLAAHLPLFYVLFVWAHGALLGQLAIASWGLGRVIDVFGSQQAIARYNAMLDLPDDDDAPPTLVPPPDNDPEEPNAPHA